MQSDLQPVSVGRPKRGFKSKLNLYSESHVNTANAALPLPIPKKTASVDSATQTIKKTE